MYNDSDVIIIIVIIKIGRQHKAGGVRFTTYQSEGHSPTIPTVADKKGAISLGHCIFNCPNRRLQSQQDRSTETVR